ncbi:trimeric intracellular cation channel family protein [Marivirga salinae]|uniref:Trimeric intracellular cation channel family protein n=1 Tax=Marivirga salinarum TaxID=3059078 RepID=A0AA51RD50_9BACT|nr:trimeric intracellular cation channel family protein [Marivirga sp. BDSF4-3]WMN12633.1 trimeric intracellular cation channel family protein [Marivirga sp. BDSF4-3]
MQIQYALELLGTLVFAISGALAVKDKSEDWFGAGFTGFVTAIGGGTLRDIMLGSYPLSWVGDMNIIYTILFGVLLTSFFNKFLQNLRKTLSLFDSMGIALFTVAGVEKALSMGLRWEIAAIMGMFSAVFGGVIRDTLVNETPVIFRKEIYASVCLLGGMLYTLLNYFQLERDINFIVTASFIMSARLLAVKYHINFPKI